MKKSIPAVTLDNPDVLNLYAQLLAGERFGKRFGYCPVCGRQKFTTRVTCSQPYCAQVWRLAKSLYRIAPTVDEKPAKEKAAPIVAPRPVKKKPTGAKPVPVVAVVPKSEPLPESERWMLEHALIDCTRMSARLAASSCGANWRCFLPAPCASVPEGATCPPIPDGWGA